MIFRRLAPLTQPPPSRPGTRPTCDRPPALGMAPLTYSKQKFADPLSWQRSRISRTQSRSKGRKSGPLSPPTITQSMLVRSRLGSGPSSGSHDVNSRPECVLIQQIPLSEAATATFGQRILMERDAESRPAGAWITVVLVLRRAHRLQPSGQRQRIAMIAAREMRSQPVSGSMWPRSTQSNSDHPHGTG